MIKNNNRNSRDDKSKSGDRSTSRRPAGTDKPKSRFNDKDGKENSGFDKKEDKEKRKSGFAAGDRKEYKPRTSRDGDSKPYSKQASGKDFKARTSAGKDFKPRTDRDESKSDSKGGFKPWEKKESGNAGYKPRAYKEGSSRDENTEGKRSYIKKDNFITDGDKSKFADKKSGTSRSTDSRPYRKRDEGGYKGKEYRGERIAPATRARKTQEPKDDGLIRLNRYIANSGICSRRKADELIEAGVISVNGSPVSELGHKIDPYKDEVRYNGELLKREKKVYVLLNKPKDYITTTDDPQERRTVMQLVEKASRERIYPVGRLDRNTTGLILMTNDGELADKLSHPKNGITKIYHVELNKSLSQGDFNKIQFGLELEDGLIKPDNVSYVAGASKREVGIQIHSGKNRIVRRIFEHLGYDVVKLDRVVYGNLTKKDLPRGRWRFLEEHELIQIKHLIK
ncbi:pseudouridine synthase [Pedobacter boryungensis]|uniref:Pseudouridine synthase n=1 Tax=Pedobacter boryungensis TaxID=869962 RepID=A0ABX2DHI3_9SPHI|nr:pseudouridine synthase [Pedobacter boryungensis]NQX32584.1 rRNA pseudouridine synthase [Pedobacter boryungensis]